MTQPERSGRFEIKEGNCLSEASFALPQNVCEAKGKEWGALSLFTFSGRAEKVRGRLGVQPQGFVFCFI